MRKNTNQSWIGEKPLIHRYEVGIIAIGILSIHLLFSKPTKNKNK